MSRAANVLLAMLCLAGAYASFAVYAEDRRARVAPSRFAEQYTMMLRRPDVVRSLDLAPSGDFASDLIADATLRDVVVPVQLSAVTPSVRAAWIDAVTRYDEQLSRAAELMLDAIAQRPGWPYHRTLLAQLVYTRDARSLSRDLVTHSTRWSVPLSSGARGAESDGSLWQSLALAYLQTWPDLGREHGANAAQVFRRAFADADFVRNAFLPLVAIVGKPAAMTLLPDSPAPLRAAFGQLETSGDLDGAWQVHQRWQAAEWRSRQRDLDRIERMTRRGDYFEVRRLCVLWTSAHSISDFDSPAARAQLARLLEVWPAGSGGDWRGDPRAAIVRYFLAGRRAAVSGPVLLRAIDGVGGVDEPTLALLRVAGGDVPAAEAIVRSSDSFGTLEWKAYIVELSRFWLRKGHRDRARAALATVPAAAREECEVSVVRAALGDEPFRNDRPRVELVWNDRADIPICMTAGRRAKLKLMLLPGPAAIVDFGWAGARSGSVFLKGTGALVTISLPAVEGFRTLNLRAASHAGRPSISLELTSEAM